MKATTIALSLLLLGGAGAAVAGKGGDESAFKVDLWAANHTQYFLKCAHGKDLANCPSPTVWQNANVLQGLQTTKSYDDGLNTIAPDEPLIG